MARKNSGSVRLPEMGQWPDKVMPVALAASAVFLVVGFLMAFLYAGPVNGASVNGAELIGGEVVANKLLLSQKIFYFHMPCAVASMFGMIAVAYYCIRYLMTKNQRFDTCSKCAMEVSLIFVVGTMITGTSGA